MSPGPAGADLVHLVVGPPRHGVVQHALRVATAGRGRVLRAPDLAATPLATAGVSMIVQFTDRLFGPDAATAATALEQAVAGADRVTVVLHDLPQVSDGAAWQCRRTGYRRVARSADLVVVSSEHEADLLRDVAPEVRPLVIPLPVEPDGTGAQPAVLPVAGPTVGVIGFLYPGKGVEQVIAAVGGLEVTVLNLGTTAPGHEALADELTGWAAQQGVRFHLTGWLSERELAAACRAIDVPVAAHQHISASGSINAWLAAGRRPLVTWSAYAQEQDDRMPGALTLVQPGELRAAVADALADPAATRHGRDVRVGPRAESVAERLEEAAR